MAAKRRAVLATATTAVAAATVVGVGAFAPAGAATTATPVENVRLAGPLHVSTHDLPQGWTRFAVTGPINRNEGYAQLFALKSGVSLARLQSDLVAAQSPDGPSPRFTLALERDTVLYGGVDVGKGQTGSFADNLGTGTYYVADVDKDPSTLTSDAQRIVVHGNRSGAPAPAVASTITMRNMHFFTSTPTLPATGTVRVTSAPTNDPDDLHFALFLPVQPGTTDDEIQAYFDSGQQGPPSFLADGPEALTGIYSPGVSNVFSYDLPAGTYALFCFITDPDTGMEHAAMGMHKVVTLTAG